VLPRLVLVLSVDPASADHARNSSRWPDPSEHVFSLDGSPTVIGRADTPGLQIPIRGDPFVSRRHAEIVELGAEWGVRDLGSTNGTRLNGMRLIGTEVRPIAAGDVIEVGHSSRLTILPAHEV
jgi:pSer/pThr/pTyr-binding forkhead associated (FHA) protein